MHLAPKQLPPDAELASLFCLRVGEDINKSGKITALQCDGKFLVKDIRTQFT